MLEISLNKKNSNAGASSCSKLTESVEENCAAKRSRVGFIEDSENSDIDKQCPV